MHRPRSWTFKVTVACEQPADFTLSLRKPAWLTAPMAVWIGSQRVPVTSGTGYEGVRRTWSNQTVFVELPVGLRAEPLPDEPTTVAFLDGPVVLAGLCDRERALYGSPESAAELLRPNADGDGYPWGAGYRTVGQPEGIRLVPLHTVADEPYSIYFPVIGR